MKRKFLDILKYVKNKMLNFLKFLNLTKIKFVIEFRIKREEKFLKSLNFPCLLFIYDYQER